MLESLGGEGIKQASKSADELSGVTAVQAFADEAAENSAGGVGGVWRVRLRALTAGNLGTVRLKMYAIAFPLVRFEYSHLQRI